MLRWSQPIVRIRRLSISILLFVRSREIIKRRNYLWIPSFFCFIASLVRMILSWRVFPDFREKLLPHPHLTFIESLLSIHFFPFQVIFEDSKRASSSFRIQIDSGGIMISVSIHFTFHSMIVMLFPAHHSSIMKHESVVVFCDFHRASVWGSNFIMSKCINPSESFYKSKCHQIIL